MRPRTNSLILVLILAKTSLFADGGLVQLRQEAGALLITVFASPSPFSAGSTADISLLLQKQSGLEPVLEANVAIRLQKDASDNEILVRPTRQQAQNKLLYAAPVTFPESGKWRLTVTVLRDGERTDATGIIDVASASEIEASYLGYLAYPPLMIAAYVVRERLIRRKPRGIKRCETSCN